MCRNVAVKVAFFIVDNFMSYQVLARKYRPHDFHTMAGQSHVLQALINALDSGRLHHAYLFTGTRGVGKTTIARIFAKCLNCETGISSKPCGVCSSCVAIDNGSFVDLIEVDAASRTRVDDTRELLDNVQYAPTNGRFKVYLIDEVHMLSTHSFNALLKTLEEPPARVKFLLATTDPQKLPVTVLSRCLQFSLKALSADVIADYLAQILTTENISFDNEGLHLLAKSGQGSMRDALSLTDQAIAFGGGKLIARDIMTMLGTIDASYIYDLLNYLIKGDTKNMLDVVQNIALQGVEFTNILNELLDLLHTIAIAQLVASDNAQIMQLAQTISASDVQFYYQVGLIGKRDLLLAPNTKTGFEMILLRMLAFRPANANHAPNTSLKTDVEQHSDQINASTQNHSDQINASTQNNSFANKKDNLSAISATQDLPIQNTNKEVTNTAEFNKSNITNNLPNKNIDNNLANHKNDTNTLVTNNEELQTSTKQTTQIKQQANNEQNNKNITTAQLPSSKIDNDLPPIDVYDNLPPVNMYDDIADLGLNLHATAENNLNNQNNNNTKNNVKHTNYLKNEQVEAKKTDLPITQSNANNAKLNKQQTNSKVEQSNPANIEVITKNNDAITKQNDNSNDNSQEQVTLVANYEELQNSTNQTTQIKQQTNNEQITKQNEFTNNNLQDLTAWWHKLAFKLNVGGLSKVLVTNLALVNIVDNNWYFELNPEFASQYSEHQNRITKALNNALNKQITMQVIMQHHQHLTPAQIMEQEQQATKEKLKTSVYNDPNIKYLIEHFSATIEHIEPIL